MVDLLNRFPCLLHSLPLSIHPSHSIQINFSNSHYLKKKKSVSKNCQWIPLIYKNFSLAVRAHLRPQHKQGSGMGRSTGPYERGCESLLCSVPVTWLGMSNLIIPGLCSLYCKAGIMTEANSLGALWRLQEITCITYWALWALVYTRCSVFAVFMTRSSHNFLTSTWSGHNASLRKLENFL